MLLPRFPPLQSGAAFSSPAFSTSAVWCRVYQSRVFHSRVFGRPAVTTSLHCCVNFTGCRYREEWNLRLRVSYTNRSLQRRQRTCLPSFDSSPGMVVLISVYLLTEQSGCSTDAHQLRGQKFRCCRTAPVEHCRLRYDRSDDQFMRHLKAHLFRA